MADTGTATAVPDAPPAAEAKTVVTSPPAGTDASKQATPPAAPAPAKDTKPAVPERYELKLPEGSFLEAKATERIAAEAKAAGLSNEQAQSLVDREHKAISSYAEAQAAVFEKAKTQWFNDAKADKEVGGDGFAKHAELAKRVVTRFGTDEFRQALDATGLGNHPEMLRFVARIGRAMSEDQLVIPGATPAPKRTAEEIFYDNSDTKKE